MLEIPSRLKLLIALICVLLLTSCSNGGIEGTWNLESAEEQGEAHESESLEEIYGGEISYIFSGDGKLTIKMPSQEVQGSWQQDGDTVTVVYNGNETVMTLSGSKLTFQKGDTVYTITKAG